MILAGLTFVTIPKSHSCEVNHCNVGYNVTFGFFNYFQPTYQLFLVLPLRMWHWVCAIGPV